MQPPARQQAPAQAAAPQQQQPVSALHQQLVAMAGGSAPAAPGSPPHEDVDMTAADPVIAPIICHSDREPVRRLGVQAGGAAAAAGQVQCCRQACRQTPWVLLHHGYGGSTTRVDAFSVEVEEAGQQLPAGRAAVGPVAAASCPP
jgi:hypothetical protein